MSQQEVKIPVSAQTAGAEKSVEHLAKSFDSVADAIAKISGNAKKAEASIIDLVSVTDDLRKMRERLSQATGHDWSEADTMIFAKGWRNLQQAKGPATAAVRRFGTFNNWLDGHRGLYTTPQAAERHRRAMFQSTAQGTGWARSQAPSDGGGDGFGGGDDGAGRSIFDRGLGRTRSMAMAAGKSMLALAGITSVIGMAAKGTALAGEEASGVDTLKRRLGDLGVDFERLRDQSRRAGDGLGMTYVESQRLAQAYASEVGNLGGDNGESLMRRMRFGAGFSRAYGLDPAEGNQFMAQMQRLGPGRSEADQRRLALMIGDAVAKSGYTAKVDDLLKAVADYTSLGARIMLATPNVDGYASAITSLMARGLPGLDPAGAAGIISAADAATRRGGALGEASQNFMYAALRNASPNLRPVDAMALMEGGLFGTTADTFGSGPLKGFMGKGVGLDNVTNFDKMMPLLRQHYGNGGYLLNAIKNTFGLQSHAQAAALAGMSTRGELGATQNLLQGMGDGVDINTISATGLATLGQIANTKGRPGLEKIRREMLERKDLSEEQRRILQGAAGSDDEVRKALGKIAATLEQEKTAGSELRQSLADMEKTLTSVGGVLLAPLNRIRDAVVAMAGEQVPGFVDVPDEIRAQQSKGSPYAAGSASKSPYARNLLKMAMGLGASKLEAAGMLGAAWAESKWNPTIIHKDIDGKNRYGMFQLDEYRWSAFNKWARQKGVSPWVHSSQIAYALKEGRSMPAVNNLSRQARDELGMAKAWMQYERPKGIPNAWGGNYTGVSGYNERVGATRDLYGMVDVNINVPGAPTKTVQVPIAPQIGAPRPAGTQGGRAPLVGGTRSY